ncbi:SGNH/GDSL hydrolase family protein [Maribacter sp. 2210JD10-5]|uniref:SGNH/GDSL hydrolase family protein n=1 Tax=Maribacter sp. 2210JD10-5 TaxID=3386272 RepID=UPI0039BC9BF2
MTDRIPKSSTYLNPTFLLFLLLNLTVLGQENTFTEEVHTITENYDSVWDESKETIVFTGSSSIRLWKNLEESFPQHQIINTGFGGSQASDLLYHIDDLVIRYLPSKVFIYEGDNDIFSKKRPNKIILTTEQIIQRIWYHKNDAQIVLISAKPSISRWKLRGRYKRLNRKLERLSRTNPLLTFVDVWNPMLNGRKPKKEIFISDGLHMNQKGYDIWFNTMKHLVE